MMRSIKYFSVTIILLFFFNFAKAQWMQTSGPEGGEVYDMELIDGVIWAGTKAGVFKSYDNGNTWVYTDIESVQFVFFIDVIGDEIFMMHDGPNPSLMRSNDGGLTWIKSALPIFMIPNNKPKLFRVGEMLFLSNLDYAYYYSDDNGASWVPMNSLGKMKSDGTNIIQWNSSAKQLNLSYDLGENWSGLGYFDWIQTMFLEDSLVVVVTTDSVYLSADLGQNFEVNAKLTNLSGEMYRESTGELIASGADVHQSLDSGVTWNKIVDVPGGFQLTGFLKADNQYVIANEDGFYAYSTSGYTKSNSGFLGKQNSKFFASPTGTVYASNLYTQFFYTTENDGLSWEQKKTPQTAGAHRFYDMAFMGDTAFIGTVGEIYMEVDGAFSTISCPSNSAHSLFVEESTMYVADSDIYYTHDLGGTWFKINGPTDISFWIVDFMIAGGKYMVLDHSGQFFVSEDLGVTWTKTYDADIYLDQEIELINEKLYLGALAVSDDFGLTWYQLSPQGLPADLTDGYPIDLLGVDGLIYGVFSYNGVYVSSDGGINWTPFNIGLEAKWGEKLAYNGSNIFLSTSNRSVWVHGSDIHQVSGVIYKDDNNNGIKDIGEKPMKGILVESNQTYTYSDGNGHYILYVNGTTDSVKVVSPTIYCTTNPIGYSLSSATDGYDFGLYFEPNHDDLKITMTNVTPFRPGFDNSMVLTVKNQGSTVLKPHVSFLLDSICTFISSTINPTSQSDYFLTWDLDSLGVLETTDILVKVNVSMNAILGDTVSFEGKVLPLVSDESPENNVVVLSKIIIGSFDPNDKQVAPSTNYSPDYLAVGRPLIYTIRFQNTGTYLAETVSIVDEISENLDIQTIEVLSASHPVEWSIREDRELEFKFNNINLPDSTSNESNSHGFVKFSIIPKIGLSLGTPMNNTAKIFFDFNLPIVTNTVVTKFDYLVNTWSVAQEINRLSAFPNPSSHTLNLYLSKDIDGPGQVELYDILGNVVFSMQVLVNDSLLGIELPNLVSGQYLVRLKMNAVQFVGQIAVVQE